VRIITFQQLKQLWHFWHFCVYYISTIIFQQLKQLWHFCNNSGTSATCVRYRKIQDMPLTGVLSINTTMNVTILTDRTTKRNTLTHTPPVPAGTSSGSTAMPGYDYERAVDSGGAIAGGAIDSGAVCAQVSMYMKQPNLLVGCASCFSSVGPICAPIFFCPMCTVW
jgi:hypothetical protein